MKWASGAGRMGTTPGGTPCQIGTILMQTQMRIRTGITQQQQQTTGAKAAVSMRARGTRMHAGTQQQQVLLQLPKARGSGGTSAAAAAAALHQHLAAVAAAAALAAPAAAAAVTLVTLVTARASSVQQQSGAVMVLRRRIGLPRGGTSVRRSSGPVGAHTLRRAGRSGMTAGKCSC